MTLAYDYTYDALGQLLTVLKGGVTVETYTYDENGNRLTSTVGAVTRAYVYDNDDRLLGYDDDADTFLDVLYTYDNSGYLTSKIDGADVTTYEYSSYGELLKVVLPGTPTKTIEYVHGVGGERLAKKVDGVITEKYLWSGVNLLAIYDAGDVLTTRFENGGMTHNGTSYYFTYDQVGSIRAIYDASGVLQGEITYDSFGNELINTIPSTLLIPIGFAGGYSDRDTGLIRFGYRDYDPNIGRWTTKDRILFASRQKNFYVYCHNNPVMYFDPSGLAEIRTRPLNFNTAERLGMLGLGPIGATFLILNDTKSAGVHHAHIFFSSPQRIGGMDNVSDWGYFSDGQRGENKNLTGRYKPSGGYPCPVEDEYVAAAINDILDNEPDRFTQDTYDANPYRGNNQCQDYVRYVFARARQLKLEADARRWNEEEMRKTRELIEAAQAFLDRSNANPALIPNN